MFKGNNNSATMNNINSPERLNRIVEGTNINGDIVSDSNIRIDGFVKGTIRTSGRLFIGAKGRIEGEVICSSAEIEGTLIGTINVKDLLTLKATAKLEGDISTNKLSIEPGAEFTGSCGMNGDAAIEKPFAVNAEVELEEELA